MSRIASVGCALSIALAGALLAPWALAEELAAPLATVPTLKLPPPLEGDVAPDVTGSPIPDIARAHSEPDRINAKNGACFRTGTVEEASARAHSAELQPFAYLQGEAPVRVQRLVADGKSATLEIVDGFVRSKGSVAVRKLSTPLVAVAQGPEGLVAYARREGPLVVVLVMAPAQERDEAPMCRMTQLFLDTRVSGGDEARVPVRLAKDKRVALSASVGVLLGKPTVTAAFGPL